jgi:hypothetical protein
MSNSALVQIVGVPVACAEGTKDSWREVSNWVAGQLRVRFGDRVQVKYYNLFDVDCPPMPAEAQLPLVLIEGEVVSSGGKISMSLLRKKLETLTDVEVFEPRG